MLYRFSTGSVIRDQWFQQSSHITSFVHYLCPLVLQPLFIILQPLYIILQPLYIISVLLFYILCTLSHSYTVSHWIALRSSTRCPWILKFFTGIPCTVTLQWQMHRYRNVVGGGRNYLMVGLCGVQDLPVILVFYCMNLIISGFSRGDPDTLIINP